MTTATIPDLRLPRRLYGKKGSGGIQVRTLAAYLPCRYCGVASGEQCHTMTPPFFKTRMHAARYEPLWDLWREGLRAGRSAA